MQSCGGMYIKVGAFYRLLAQPTRCENAALVT
jgi:hypothetical protein